MRISDWSSDVCSSDLLLEETRLDLFPLAILYRLEQQILERHAVEEFTEHVIDTTAQRLARCLQLFKKPGINLALASIGRSEERRVGKGGVSKCRSGWSPCN